MDDQTGLSRLEMASIIATLGMGIGLALLAWASAHYQWLIWLAASVGALGGLVHEIAQSGGRIMFFQTHQDGMYLGSLAGMVLGAVAGLLVIRGHLISGGTVAASVNTVQITYEVFIAGLALKGVTEAAGGKPVP
jgi:hypothetical protein